MYPNDNYSRYNNMIASRQSVPYSNYPTSNYGSNDDRLGGFVFPFLLGGVTGAAIAPAFWNRPTYPYYPPYYNPYYPRYYY